MDFVSILHVLEDGIYEVVMWVVLLPKTLVRVLLRPGWIQPYVTAEWGKKAVARFQGYVSPMLFWLLVGILPYAIWDPNFSVQSGAAPTLVQPVESTFLLNTLFLVTFPAYYAVVLQLLRHEPVEKEAVKRLFYIECYVHTPIALLGVPLVVLFLNWSVQQAGTAAATGSVVPGLLAGYAGLMGLWIVLVEGVIFRAELKTGWARALGLSLVYALMGFVLMVLFFFMAGVVLVLLP